MICPNLITKRIPGWNLHLIGYFLTARKLDNTLQVAVYISLSVYWECCQLQGFSEFILCNTIRFRSILLLSPQSRFTQSDWSMNEGNPAFVMLPWSHDCIHTGWGTVLLMCSCDRTPRVGKLRMSFVIIMTILGNLIGQVQYFSTFKAWKNRMKHIYMCLWSCDRIQEI